MPSFPDFSTFFSSDGLFFPRSTFYRRSNALLIEPTSSLLFYSGYLSARRPFFPLILFRDFFFPPGKSHISLSAEKTDSRNDRLPHEVPLPFWSAFIFPAFFKSFLFRRCSLFSLSELSDFSFRAEMKAAERRFVSFASPWPRLSGPLLPISRLLETFLQIFHLSMNDAG